MAQNKKYAIILAGGNGTRFSSEIPKQFFPLKGIPILFHSIYTFVRCFQDISIILVLPDSQTSYWEELCNEYNFTIPITIASAGDSRFESVKSGLSKITEKDSIVAIHDAARPLVTERMIIESFKLAKKNGTAVPAIPVTDSIRLVKNEDLSQALEREYLFAVQTPQTFKLDILNEAYKSIYRKFFTDDASVVEASGYKINIYPGEQCNIKITRPMDIAIANYFLENE